MAEYTSRASDRTDGHRFHPAIVCTRNFVFGHGRDRNGGGKHKAEAHILPQLFNNLHATTNRNKYSGYEGGNSKFSGSEPAYNGYGGVDDVKLNVSEPTLIDSGGWVRPSRIGWAMPPEVPLSKVTHDVDAAADYARGSGRPREAPLSKVTHDVDAAADYARGTGRHREAPLSKVTHDVDAAADYVRGPGRAQSAGLFGRDQWSSATLSPYQGRRATATIDSKQAAKKYGGQFIW